MTKICRRFVISGRVQGVFFRQGTADHAKALGLHGWVRNLPSGEVEALICGEDRVVMQMETWLHQGPPAARVQQVEAHILPWQEHVDFSILRG